MPTPRCRHISLWLWLLPELVFLSYSQCRSLLGADVEPQVVAAVIIGIEHNYEHLPSFRATLKVAKDFSGMAKLEEGRHQPPPLSAAGQAGTTVATPIPPPGGGTPQLLTSISWIEQVAVDGSRLKWEKRIGSRVLNSWLVTEGESRQYIPNAKSLLLTEASVIPGTLPIDPQNYGLPSAANSLLAFLKTQKPLSGHFVTVDGHSVAILTYAYEIRHQSKLLEFRFDSAVTFLPVRVDESRSTDRKLVSRSTLEYRPFLPTLFFPRRMTCKQVHPSHVGTDPDAYRDGVTEVEVVDLDIKPSFSREDFDLRVPADVAIHDNRITHRLADGAAPRADPSALSPSTKRSPLIPFLWINVVGMFCLIAWFLRRRLSG